jgi:hypothetical protein
MFKRRLKDKKLLFLIAVCVILKLFSLNEVWVEQYYTYGFYPFISSLFRGLFGWIPFSIGDLLYAGAALYLIFKIVRIITLAFKKRLKEAFSWDAFFKTLKLVLIIYFLFNVLWGLNYNRQGIAFQLELDVKPYNVQELFKATGLLQQKLNFYAQQIDSIERSKTNVNSALFNKGVRDYEKAAQTYPYLKYRFSSIKPSLYGTAGKYFGYTGYYNPFTGEAQLKPNLPVFIKPFVINHEIAHAVGYAKENEANFVSYLVSKQSTDIYTLYSVYFEMFEYAYLQCMMTENREHTAALKMGLHKRVRNDLRELFLYRKSTKNAIEPYISHFYDRYLKLNNQPKGKATYNEVIGWLIAYMNKYGPEAI